MMKHKPKEQKAFPIVPCIMDPGFRILEIKEAITDEAEIWIDGVGPWKRARELHFVGSHVIASHWPIRVPIKSATNPETSGVIMAHVNMDPDASPELQEAVAHVIRLAYAKAKEMSEQAKIQKAQAVQPSDQSPLPWRMGSNHGQIVDSKGASVGDFLVEDDTDFILEAANSYASMREREKELEAEIEELETAGGDLQNRVEALEGGLQSFAEAWAEWHDSEDQMPTNDLITMSSALLDLMGWELVERRGKHWLKKVKPRTMMNRLQNEIKMASTRREAIRMLHVLMRAKNWDRFAGIEVVSENGIMIGSLGNMLIEAKALLKKGIEAKPMFEIPDGFRMREIGEMRCKGDLFCSVGATSWAGVAPLIYTIGQEVLHTDTEFYFCAISREEAEANAQKEKQHSGWIGVDFDATLARYDGWKGHEFHHIGPPIPSMMNRIRKWIAAGVTVKIFTARAAIPEQIGPVARWLIAHGLPSLEITNIKDRHMYQLWDDRAVQVEPNTGRRMDGQE